MLELGSFYVSPFIPSTSLLPMVTRGLTGMGNGLAVGWGAWQWKLGFPVEDTSLTEVRGHRTLYRWHSAAFGCVLVCVCRGGERGKDRYRIFQKLHE